ncbi:hypothetical protein L1987_29998 [Smallanthus sonchifolius]|uniref:Uncharacterized protein n=1 Tax=Smallanthus sonchifolius TaxID=185202 RepID=A0ACB9I348_9ASTR|nr:hypothetical protein L1987_29998 [Smallanthus sonchifolius]
MVTTSFSRPRQFPSSSHPLSVTTSSRRVTPPLPAPTARSVTILCRRSPPYSLSVPERYQPRATSHAACSTPETPRTNRLFPLPPPSYATTTTTGHHHLSTAFPSSVAPRIQGSTLTGPPLTGLLLRSQSCISEPSSPSLLHALQSPSIVILSIPFDFGRD